MSADASKTVPALPSATVVMLRDGAHGPELLMVRRRAGDVFGDSYAFPGGLVDDNEPTAHEYCRGISAEEANRLLHVADGGLNFYSAAIRELFEETGVLLARDFLRGQGLHMACDALHYFAHWETPLIQPKRWSARFFFAEMPIEQDVLHDGSELTDSLWITAADALAASRAGKMKLPFPTIRNLETFSDIASVDGLITWANERAIAGVSKIRPARFEKDGKWKWTIPGDADYPGE
jgi:8-oxo-dGTP pyrophosphatase MutT (NUDIX family)